MCALVYRAFATHRFGHFQKIAFRFMAAIFVGIAIASSKSFATAFRLLPSGVSSAVCLALRHLGIFPLLPPASRPLESDTCTGAALLPHADTVLVTVPESIVLKNGVA
jgi:hypothetical protein